ncbi:MAG: hypothetical protein EPN25_10310 [Nitrospirae bacterium]|nr:MAG: hypothetical protein EPN25_10310 [Nitrospirota bacterium]
MEIIIEFICSFFGDFLLQVVAELVIEFGLQRLSEEPEKCKPFISFVGYGLLGLAAGGLSLYVFPHPFVRSARFHGISLIISPLFTGLAMSGMGNLRRRQGKLVLRIDSFIYGFIFAFGMSLIRFLYTR